MVERPTKAELRAAIKTHEDGSIRTGETWTICEVLRHIYKLTVGAPNEREIKDLVAEATIYAKKMDTKLRQYKGDYDMEIFPLKEEKGD